MANLSIRIIPHPDKTKRVFKTKTDKKNDEGVVVRKSGTRMYRYLVVGSPEALKEYRLARGVYYREIDKGEYKGQPLWNDQRRFTKPMDLYITEDGLNVGVAEDDLKLAMLSKMQEAKEFGVEFEKAIASRLADIFVSELANPNERKLEPVKPVAKVTDNTEDETDIPDDELELSDESDESIDDPLNIGG